MPGKPRTGRCDGLIEVLGEPPIAIEPRKGAFDDPAARQNLEAAGGIGSPDDRDSAFAYFVLQAWLAQESAAKGLQFVEIDIRDRPIFEPPVSPLHDAVTVMLGGDTDRERQ